MILEDLPPTLPPKYFRSADSLLLLLWFISLYCPNCILTALPVSSSEHSPVPNSSSIRPLTRNSWMWAWHALPGPLTDAPSTSVVRNEISKSDAPIPPRSGPCEPLQLHQLPLLTLHFIGFFFSPLTNALLSDVISRIHLFLVPTLFTHLVLAKDLLQTLCLPRKWPWVLTQSHPQSKVTMYSFSALPEDLTHTY